MQPPPKGWEILLRVVLYAVIAVVPVIIGGIQTHQPTVYIVCGALYAAAVTITGYFDGSGRPPALPLPTAISVPSVTVVPVPTGTGSPSAGVPTVTVTPLVSPDPAVPPTP